MTCSSSAAATSPRLALSLFLAALHLHACVLLVLAGALISLADASSSSPPSFVSVSKDREVMAKWLQVASERHARDVRKAKDSYSYSYSYSDSSDQVLDVDVDVLDRIRLDRHDVTRAKGALPDFHDDLPKTVCVTSSETPLFTRDEVKEVIDAAEQHFQDTNRGEWNTLNSGQYPVAGFWIRDIPAVHRWFVKMTQTRLLPLLQREFPAFVGSTSHNLVVDNAYLFKYTAKTGRRTDVHTDSGCLSFTIALNGKDDYRGGGTWFEGLGDDGTGAVIEMDAGQVTIRPGGVRHCGYAVESGERYIIGGFCMHIGKVEYVRMLLAEGLELRAKQKVDQAKQAWEVAIALNPSFDGPYSHLASLYSDALQSPDTAAKVLQHCYDHVNRDSGEIAYSLGVARFESGQYQQAEVCLMQCLESDATDADAMMALARVKASQGDIDSEREWYQKIVDLPSKVADDALLAKAYCNLGVLSNEDPTQSVDDEIVWYLKSLGLNPTDNFAASYSLGCAYATKHEFSNAIAAFRGAVDAASDDKPEEKRSALSNLYRVIMSQLQQKYPNGPESRESMMKEFIDAMGEENYAELAKMRQ